MSATECLELRSATERAQLRGQLKKAYKWVRGDGHSQLTAGQEVRIQPVGSFPSGQEIAATLLTQAITHIS